MNLVIETRIDGIFFGWQRNVAYTLMDGTRWKLAPLLNLHEPREDGHPTAKLWQDGSQFYLEVQTTGDTAEVVRAD